MHPSEDPARQPTGGARVVDAGGLPALFEALRGRTVIGPTVRDEAIVLAELTAATTCRTAGAWSWTRGATG